jgi:glutamate-1-semialdehyde 2,1-aminomutase
VPSSPGVPACLADHTITLPYNDAAALQQAFAELGEQIACVIVEPVVGNMNCVPPVPGFLEEIRAQCDKYAAVFIVDEVMTGFRLGLQGAQGHYGIEADITTLGKVIGGGMPVGAFGGKRKIMEQISPLGPVYQAGTLSGNPVAMRAGLKTLELISAPGFYEPIFARTDQLMAGLRTLASQAGIPFTTNHVGSMFGFFFSEEETITNYAQVMACDNQRFNRFFHAMLDQGVYLAPASYEAGFMSAAHTPELIEQTLDAAERAFAQL